MDKCSHCPMTNCYLQPCVYLVVQVCPWFKILFPFVSNSLPYIIIYYHAQTKRSNNVIKFNLEFPILSFYFLTFTVEPSIIRARRDLGKRVRINKNMNINEIEM